MARIMKPTAKLRWFKVEKSEIKKHVCALRSDNDPFHPSNDGYELRQWWQDTESFDGEWRAIEIHSNEP